MGIKLSYVNYLDDASPIESSSEQTNFPVENVINPFRSKSWRSTIGQIEDQYLRFDCGFQVRPTTLIITNEQKGIQLSPLAVIKLRGNNDGNWATPQCEHTITWHESIITKLISPYFGSYRFWELYIDDPNNVANYIEIGNVFLGESVSFTSSDVKFGWKHKIVDDSDKTESDGNEPWFDKKTLRDKIDFDMEYMNKIDWDALQKMIRKVGKHKPFYVHLDPDLKISANQNELCRYVRLQDTPDVPNVFLDMYNISLTLEEAV